MHGGDHSRGWAGVDGWVGGWVGRRECGRSRKKGGSTTCGACLTRLFHCPCRGTEESDFNKEGKGERYGCGKHSHCRPAVCRLLAQVRTNDMNIFFPQTNSGNFEGATAAGASSGLNVFLPSQSALHKSAGDTL